LAKPFIATGNSEIADTGLAHQGRENWMVCDDVKQRSDNSQFLRHLILNLIVSQNVKMRGPTPDMTAETLGTAETR
jgi:hypothetical protein